MKFPGFALNFICVTSYDIFLLLQGIILCDILSVSFQRFLQGFTPNVLISVFQLLCVIFSSSRVNK